jgi:hypothetical protein
MTGRGRRGGGTVFYDKDRKCYVGQVSYIDDAGKRQRPKVFGQTAEEAQDKLDALRAELKTTGSVAPKDLTVRHIMEDLLAHPPSQQGPGGPHHRRAGEGQARPADSHPG